MKDSHSLHCSPSASSTAHLEGLAFSQPSSLVSDPTRAMATVGGKLCLEPETVFWWRENGGKQVDMGCCLDGEGTLCFLVCM